MTKLLGFQLRVRVMFRKPALSLLLMSLCLSTLSHAESELPSTPTQIKHIVVFGNAYSDTGNTRELFDELAGRKKPSRLREDVRYHGPDVIDASSSLALSTALWSGAWYMNWDRFLNQYAITQSYVLTSRMVGVSLLASFLYQSGIGHFLSSPIDMLVDRSDLLLNAILWLYPGVGLPVLPPGQLYDRGGRFTNGPRIWAEILALRLGLDPDQPLQFLSLAYAGSHVRQRLSENDMLSMGAWVNYLDIGKGVANTLLSKNSSSSEKDSFWSKAAMNMSEGGRTRFENLIKNGVPPSFEYMVEDYGNRERYAGVREPESTLYVIAYGPDDYLIDDAEPEDVIAALQKGLETLITRDGAQHIIIRHLTPLNSPALSDMSSEKKQHIQQKVDSHNYRQDELINELRERNPNLMVTVFTEEHNLLKAAKKQRMELKPCLQLASDTEKLPKDHSIIRVPRLSNKTMFTDPITNDGSSLQAVYRFVGKDVACCNDPDNYLFYDHFNLTSRGHKLAAQVVCELLSDNGYQCK